MELLKERIRKEGKVLPGNIVKVDGFLNHRVDPVLMRQIAEEFKKRFAGEEVTLILTAEASGIALATVCAAGLCRQDQSDFLPCEPLFELFCDLTHQIRVHTMVQEAIHLHNIAG